MRDPSAVEAVLATQERHRTKRIGLVTGLIGTVLGGSGATAICLTIGVSRAEVRDLSRAETAAYIAADQTIKKSIQTAVSEAVQPLIDKINDLNFRVTTAESDVRAQKSELAALRALAASSLTTLSDKIDRNAESMGTRLTSLIEMVGRIDERTKRP